MSRALELAAPAKLNLFLRVVGRRPDGYHCLDGLAAFCAFGDTVGLRAGGGDGPDRVEVTGPFAGRVEAPDLVARAIAAWRAASGLLPPVRATVRKRIPVAAGLGGGSADAAAALRGLQALAPEPLPGGALLEVARSLGADVPLCLAGAPARTRGIGDRLDPAGPLPALPAVLAAPEAALLSGEVFRRFDGPFSPPAPDMRGPWTAAALFELLEREGGNDLLRPAAALAPAVGEVLAELAALAGARHAGMSGSGSACFALFAPGDEAAATQGAAALARRGLWAVATRLPPGAAPAPAAP